MNNSKNLSLMPSVDTLLSIDTASLDRLSDWSRKTQAAIAQEPAPYALTQDDIRAIARAMRQTVERDADPQEDERQIYDWFECDVQSGEREFHVRFCYVATVVWHQNAFPEWGAYETLYDIDREKADDISIDLLWQEDVETLYDESSVAEAFAEA